MSDLSRTVPRFAALVAATLLAAAPSPATVYTVSSPDDVVAADGVCSLREAIRAAATNLAVNDCPAGSASDEIVLAAEGPFTFDQGEELLSGLDVDLTIRGGPGIARPEVRMEESNRFLHVTSGARAAVRGVKLSGGSAHQASPNRNGGAIRVEGASLELVDSIVAGSSAALGGGVSAFIASPGQRFLVERTRFEGNSATGLDPNAGASFAGGGLELNAQENTIVRLVDLEFVENRASSTFPASVAGGGGARLILTNSVIATIGRLTFESNLAEAANLAWAAGLELGRSNPSGGSVAVSDLEFHGNRLVHPSADKRARHLLLSSAGPSALTLRRVRAYGFDEADDAEYALQIEASNGASIVASDLLSVGGPPVGLRALAGGAGTEVVVGGATIFGHSGVGVQLAESAGSLRFENSIAWGNGTVVANDVDVTGSPAWDRVLQHNWIGELGDPDPEFVASGAGDFHLEATSGALDAGEATFDSVGSFDAAHAPRVAGGGLDLGAFERDALFGDDFESGDAGAWAGEMP
jgi:CSLREA domain-containing protein